jgi:3-hydroxyisobutyrate dehydrogenase-like beta-hydroxyacid dehydrogenase
LKTAQVNNAKMALVQTTQQIYLTAIEQGYGADNITGIAQIYTC